jgi:hypothetical protein
MARVTGETLTDRLDYLDALIENADPASLARLASSELPRMTQAWRAVLTDHQPDTHGRCRRCRPWWRPTSQPCRVWADAYEHLVTAPASEPTSPMLTVGGPR